IGQKLLLSEYERLQLARMQGARTDSLTGQIYDDEEINTRAIRLRMELARGDVLQDGKLTLTDENGLTIEADFGVPNEHIVNPDGADWDDTSTSVPMTDIQKWL